MSTASTSDTGQPSRRSATVVFADISGFTALSERLDPEEVTGIINACFERLESILLAHGGIIDGYLGDCIKAVFGFSPVTGNPTLHAVQAACELREALAQFNRDTQLPTPLDLHIGVNTGAVTSIVVPGAAEHDFSVMGAAVDLAARLEDASGTGQIFVGPQTYEETRDEFDYRALAHLETSSGPVPIFELMARRPSRRRKRQSERRLATVLFTELAGLDALAACIGNAAFPTALNDCFTQLSAAVAEHGGVVDKYMGHGMMALFGVPNAIENAPRQAVNAAIEIRRRLALFNTTRALPVALELHIGVNTGLVIAGEIGGRVKRDFTVMGDTVNLAARLKEAAPRGAIYVGKDTQHATRDDFEYRALDPLPLKGKAARVAAYELTSQAKQVHRARPRPSTHQIASALVGRDAELERVQAQLALLQAGRGGIVSLVGEAGMGKSRLMSEVAAATGTLDVRLLEGRSLYVGQGLSFHPFVDLLRRWADIGDDEPDVGARSKLETAVTALFRDETADVFPLVATLMGMQLDPSDAARVAGIEGDALEKLILNSMRELFRRMAAQQPLVLVFEDLHWADLSSVNLLAALLRLVLETPVLFINICRPQFPATSDHILQMSRDHYADRHVEIHLEGLNEGQTNVLIHNLLNIDDLPVATRALIAGKADGNPFYIEEVVRSLIDQGAIEYHDGRYRVTSKIDTVVVPETIQDVIMARVDRLDETKRHLLQVASVIGRSFYYSIITNILARDYALDDDLAVLKRKELLTERRLRWSVGVGEQSVAEELEYIFKHALVQDTVYASVLLKTRKELHGRVQEAIESLYGDRLGDFYGLLAYHSTRAERFEAAHDYLFKAGEVAARSAAASEALRFFEEAARIYTQLYGDGGDPKRKALLEKNIGLALLNKGSLTESIAHFDRSLAFLGVEPARSTAALYLRFGLDLGAVLYHLYVRAGKRAASASSDHERELFEVTYNRAKAFTTSDPRRLFFDTIGGLRRLNRTDPRAVGQAAGIYAGVGALFAFSGVSFAISKRFLRYAKTLVRDGNARDIFAYRSMEFISEYLGGDWQDAWAVDERLVAQALRNGQLWDVNTYLGLNCDRKLRQGDFATTRAQLAMLDHMIQAYGFAFAQSNYDGMMTLLLIEQRQLDAALRAAEQYVAIVHEPALQVLALGSKGKVLTLLGELEAASATLAAAEQIVQAAGDVPPWHLSAFAVARLLLDATRLEHELPGAARRSLQRQAAHDARFATKVVGKVAANRPEVYQLAARVAWCRGDVRDAAKWWRKSLVAAQRLSAKPELARTFQEIGQRLTQSGSRLRTFDGQGGAAYLGQARRLFADMQLTWDLDQLARATTATRDAA